MTVKLLSEQHLGFLSLKWGYTGSSESTHVKMSHCWKSCIAAHIQNCLNAGIPFRVNLLLYTLCHRNLDALFHFFQE